MWFAQFDSPASTENEDSARDILFQTLRDMTRETNRTQFRSRSSAQNLLVAQLELDLAKFDVAKPLLDYWYEDHLNRTE